MPLLMCVYTIKLLFISEFTIHKKIMESVAQYVNEAFAHARCSQ